MEKRIRSPNYPALSLPEAIEKVATLYRNQHTHAAPREVAVKSMGYNSLHGASATAISALHKYGLLDRQGEEVKVSDRALRILHPHSPAERREAIREAATEPALFSEIAERFPGRLPNEEVLRNYLIRKGFAPTAAAAVILAYRETAELVEQAAGDHDPRGDALEETSPVMAIASSASQQGQSPLHHNSAILQRDERQIGVNDLEDGGYVRIVASKDIDTEEALEWAEDIIARKRRELAKRKERAAREHSGSMVPLRSNDGGDEE